MTYSFRPHGVCSREMQIEIDDKGIIQNFSALGGCSGNLSGLGALVRGMSAEEAIERLSGIQCGPRKTSCPDQLAQGLKEYLSSKN